MGTIDSSFFELCRILCWGCVPIDFSFFELCLSYVGCVWCVSGSDLVESSSQNTRLMRDLSRLMRLDTEKLGFSLQLKNDDALNEWNINLFGFSDCPLAEVGALHRRLGCFPDC